MNLRIALSFLASRRPQYLAVSLRQPPNIDPPEFRNLRFSEIVDRRGRPSARGVRLARRTPAPARPGRARDDRAYGVCSEGRAVEDSREVLPQCALDGARLAPARQREEHAQEFEVLGTVETEVGAAARLPEADGEVCSAGPLRDDIGGGQGAQKSSAGRRTRHYEPARAGRGHRCGRSCMKQARTLPLVADQFPD